MIYEPEWLSFDKIYLLEIFLMILAQLKGF